MPGGKRPKLVTLDLLKKYNRPGPRYTSYPTAVEFHEGFAAGEYEEKLAEADRLRAAPLSLYLHLPFCQERCTFCGCHVVITKKRAVSRRYLEYLKHELSMVAERLPNRRGVAQYHWGGGTPTYHPVSEIEELHDAVTEHFEILPDAEVAIEVDPRVTTREQIDLLKRLGFNRLSMGVQDFTPEVQEVIGRNQEEASTRDLYTYCRGAGFESINLDLVYGLPLQTPETFRKNLQSVLSMRPDRVAVYSFAFVPWIRGNQKGFDERFLPSPEAKLELFHLALEAFLGEGYLQIGMDHFALPDDELSVAMRGKRLHRNFMGYTTKPASDMIGLGISAIGDLRGAFVQNEKKLSRYYEAIDEDRLPAQRGIELDRDDQIRRFVITELMCNFHLDKSVVGERFGIEFDRYFATELKELKEPESHGFLRMTGRALDITPTGFLLVRNICMVFDKYLKQKGADDRPVFSQTI